MLGINYHALPVQFSSVQHMVLLVTARVNGVAQSTIQHGGLHMYSTRRKKLPKNWPFNWCPFHENGQKTWLERRQNGHKGGGSEARTEGPVQLPVQTGACIG